MGIAIDKTVAANRMVPVTAHTTTKAMRHRTPGAITSRTATMHSRALGTKTAETRVAAITAGQTRTRTKITHRMGEELDKVAAKITRSP
jgi:hypothetical protein